MDENYDQVLFGLFEDVIAGTLTPEEALSKVRLDKRADLLELFRRRGVPLKGLRDERRN